MSAIRSVLWVIGLMLMFGGVGHIEYQGDFLHNDTWQVWLTGITESLIGLGLMWLTGVSTPQPVKTFQAGCIDPYHPNHSRR